MSDRQVTPNFKFATPGAENHRVGPCTGAGTSGVLNGRQIGRSGDDSSGSAASGAIVPATKANSGCTLALECSAGGLGSPDLWPVPASGPLDPAISMALPDGTPWP